jgi:hypothetical protein
MVLTKQFNLLHQQMVLKQQVLLSPLYFVVAGGTLANPVNLNYYMTGLVDGFDGGALKSL